MSLYRKKKHSNPTWKLAPSPSHVNVVYVVVKRHPPISFTAQIQERQTREEGHAAQMINYAKASTAEQKRNPGSGRLWCVLKPRQLRLICGKISHAPVLRLKDTKRAAHVVVAVFAVRIRFVLAVRLRFVFVLRVTGDLVETPPKIHSYFIRKVVEAWRRTRKTDKFSPSPRPIVATQ